MSVTLCLLRLIISYLYIKISCMYFCIEGLHMTSENKEEKEN